MLGYYIPDDDYEEEATDTKKKPPPVRCQECEGHGLLFYCDCARGKGCGNYREEPCYKCDGKGYT